ncbi:Aurora kinase C [Tritrichomonas foetus]|uniref:Aurora kinase C n=1 Tax=Tritrichomonas foetus TaxID=1144522 RepID=A0A1J4KTQ2_9EUKA|nr:Aurora kinase C [Tritrichomonas foetus]|eukprot:OHT13140.1 Aurora kinase C [Tritrichomonas foetus]
MTVKSDNDEYDIIDEVGCGRFGKVVKVHSRKYDRVFAIKRSPKNGSNVYNESMYHSEVKYLPMLEHKNIVNVYDYFEDGENYNIVLEYCGVKTLHDLITENAVLPLCTIKKIFKEILEAITYAHSQNISHRDLKPCNICIDAKGNVKIVDWGFAIQSKNLVNSFCGTFPFAAPECIKKVPYNPCKSDMWSIGVSLYLAAFGKNPFDDISMSISISKALQCDYTISPNADKMLVNLIQGLLKLDPDARLDAAGALSHPFLIQKK